VAVVKHTSSKDSKRVEENISFLEKGSVLPFDKPAKLHLKKKTVNPKDRTYIDLRKK
jgi:hypothetical protein